VQGVAGPDGESASMSIHWTDDRIREFWAEQSRTHGMTAAASWSDISVMEMEVRQILNYLKDGDRVLDVGCANGYSTLQFARSRRIDLVGVDYIEGMIQSANEHRDRVAAELAGRVRFQVGDALGLEFGDGAFDSVIVIRVIINLGDRERQVRALRECARVVRPGGMLLLSEATEQGWTRLNALREEWGLAAIPMPSFNHYLDEDHVRATLAPTCDWVETVNYASTYYVGTRVLKPLLARVAGREDQITNPLSELNRWFSQLPAAGDYGTQKILVFRKRG
jgi:ubiquinone/menaquinone biosynthesis C-methylase UbiE